MKTNQVESELNRIYGKVGISCKVAMAPLFDYEPLKTKSFDVTGSGLFSTETTDMKNIIAAYYNNENYTENAAILFIIKDVTGNEGTAGDMPRGKQFGYLFPGSNEVTVAHEIGHGIFKLEHPSNRSATANSFKEGALPDNLMEYNGGATLVKLQWDAIHSPGHVIGVFEKDEDAMSVYKTDIETTIGDASDISIAFTGSTTFMTPAGTLITLPENYEKISFTTKFPLKIPNGALTKFTIDGEWWCGHYGNDFTEFLGYVSAKEYDEGIKVYYPIENTYSAENATLGFRDDCSILLKNYNDYPLCFLN